MGSKASKVKEKKAKPVLSDKDKAILDLKKARDRLKKYQLKLEHEQQALHENARKLLQSGKKVRLICLFSRRKIQYLDRIVLN